MVLDDDLPEGPNPFVFARPDSPAVCESQAPNDLRDWLSWRGGQCPKVGVFPSRFGQALLTTEAIDAGECVIMLPAGSLLHVPSAQRNVDPAITAMFSREAIPSHTLLAVSMLEEWERPQSDFHLYLHWLPASYAQHPNCYREEDLAWLTGSMARDRILKRRQHLQEQYSLLLDAAPHFARFSPEAFGWARTAVDTRCFEGTIEDVQGPLMAPLLDMITHAQLPNIRWRNENGGLEAVAKRRIAPGELLTVSYGRKSTQRFFASYGFIEADTRTDHCRLVVDLPETDPLRESKQRLVEAKSHRMEMSLGSDIATALPEAMAIFRIREATTLPFDQLEPYRKPGVLGPEIEQRAWQAFIQACEAALDAHHPRFRKIDAASESLTTTQHLITELIQRERQLLRQYLAVARKERER